MKYLNLALRVFIGLASLLLGLIALFEYFKRGNTAAALKLGVAVFVGYTLIQQLAKAAGDSRGAALAEPARPRQERKLVFIIMGTFAFVFGLGALFMVWASRLPR